uniref:Putative thyropin n=1 Tax=Ixodes ricinus TaxID=34613 RepID=A0A090XAV6_IXORI
MLKSSIVVLAICFVVYINCVPTRVADHGTFPTPRVTASNVRQREERDTSPLAVHIECNPDGSYKPMQCFGDPKQPRRMCACYDQEYDQIKAPSRQLKTCNCLAEHHEKSKSTHSQVGVEIPKCNLTSGYYEQMQCNTQQHWCVDPEHGTALGKKKGTYPEAVAEANARPLLIKKAQVNTAKTVKDCHITVPSLNKTIEYISKY